jgi:hypothetical protein
MSDSLFIATVVLTFAFLTIVIIKADKKPKYEIKYLRGWWVIRDVKTQTHLRRFSTNEEAIEWFNENCNQL